MNDGRGVQADSGEAGPPRRVGWRARRSRRVRNEVLGRTLNEKIDELSEQLGIEDNEQVGFLCECSTVRCRARIHMTRTTYRAFHSRRDDFLVTPGHQHPDIERVVESGPGYLLVRKRDLPK